MQCSNEQQVCIITSTECPCNFIPINFESSSLLLLMNKTIIYYTYTNIYTKKIPDTHKCVHIREKAYITIQEKRFMHTISLS